MDKPHVLCVDDNARLLKTLKTGLESCGIEVTTACDGLDALTQYQSRPGEFDAVLTDNEMPRMNGRQFVHLLREQGYKGRIFVMSGDFEEGDPELYSREGISGLLRKPFGILELKTSLMNHCSCSARSQNPRSQ
jgi:CheY-like chemotaxis protein